MPGTVRPDELEPGDVFLYRGTGLVSRLIRLFDGSEYSHASIWDGRNVAEAIAAGVKSRELATSVGGTRVDVFRFRSDSGHGLGDPECPAQPVLDDIARFVSQGERYAYEQDLLLALLTTTRKLPFGGWASGLGVLLRTVLDSAAEFLETIVAAGKQPMICSELVYRCYDEAGAAYRLRIVGADILMRHSLHEAALLQSTPLATPEKGDRELQDLSAAGERFLHAYAAAKGTKVPLTALETTAIPDFVTPRDLRSSPNLSSVGRLVL